MLTAQEWQVISSQVTDAMNVHVKPFVAPISASMGAGGRHVGTGTYVTQGGRRTLLSCEHVLAVGRHYRFSGSEKVWGHQAEWSYDKALDVAFLDVPDEPWDAFPHDAQAVPYQRFAERHHTIGNEEILFFRGYAGENSQFLVDTLEANASGYGTQEVRDTGDGDHFEIFWEPTSTRLTAGTSEEARQRVKYRDPHGFSGSLVWNTRYCEVTRAGETWAPAEAVVVGMVQQWLPGAKRLRVLRVEHVRNWLDLQTPG
ncbi:hypothetical protein [Caulobacter sp. 602-1]|uniref:hypothetical protein n=1 Tax=Caulobacter sp. 602-1 TaxID=2492472 RepID=UPI000F62E44D|nr:hypothetical protein [Caulobacter sp. 602-1]RRN64700.1 hypothetical protein EIK80_11740 [Caulobacter sp. 602-1]